MSGFAEQISGYSRYLETSTTKAATTKTRYVYEVERFARYVEDRPFTEVQPADILAWNGMLFDARAAQGTIGQKHAALRGFLQYMKRFGEDVAHATRLLEAMEELGQPQARTPQRETFALTADQVKRILDAAGRRRSTGIRDRAMLNFLWATGTRRAEAATLQLEKLQLTERMALVLGKGSKWRTVIFDEPCRVDLEAWLAQRVTWDPPASVQEVFISVNCVPLTFNSVGRIVSETAKRAGLRKEVWTHIFRHSRITALLDTGMSLQNTARIAGHASVNTTMRYFHEDPEKLKEEYDGATRGGRQGDQGGPDGAIPARTRRGGRRAVSGGKG